MFRRIDRWGRTGTTALDPQSVNAVLKRRCALAGLQPGPVLGSRAQVRVHDGGVSLREAMRLSQHRSVQQAARYFNEAELDRGLAVRLI